MFRRASWILVAALVISSCLSGIESTTTPYTSWVFRGNPQLNNTVLQFNYGDTLNIACVGQGITVANVFYISITKGASAPKNMSVALVGGGQQSMGLVEIDPVEGGTSIYDDGYGVYPGYENFIVIPGSLYGAVLMAKEIRTVNVGILRSEDAGTYHCSALTLLATEAIGGDSPGGYYYVTSGGITIVVNTKPGQARSTNYKASNMMTYSALLLGASKFLF